MRYPTVTRTTHRNTTLIHLWSLIFLAGAIFLLNSSQARAETASNDWEKAAGGKMSFDVASVKQNKSGPPQWQAGKNLPTSNIPLNSGDDHSSTGGFFSATNTPLSDYIGFAYKLTFNQARVIFTQLPKWALQDRFDIEARAQGNPTKDQMRLMMQALLADRFNLAAQFETRPTPVFELVLARPPQLGSQLRLHVDDPPCPANSPEDSGGTVAGGFPVHCGAYIPMQATAPGRQRMGARNLAWQTFTDTIGLMGRLEDHPVVDRTGLTGTVDFVMEWTPGSPSTSDFQPDESGPTFPEALQDQLGLKLNLKVDPVELLVIDHVDEPSAN